MLGRAGIDECSPPGAPGAAGSSDASSYVFGADSGPTWSSWAEATRVVLDRRHLRATTCIALVVGTVLFCINQLDVVLAGNASTATWVKSGITYLVPFVVSNLGVFTATRRHP